MLKRVLPAVVQIRTDRSWGSGVIIQHISGTGQAEVLTNQHVIADASSIKVIISGGTEYTATLVGSDPTADLALVRFCCSVGLTALTLGDSVSLPAGTQVIAVGYPLGLSGPPTVTQGIVSAVRYDGEGQRWLVQTDAAINPGNSGGALIKLDGSLIGINTQVVRSSGGVSVEGFGFAVAAQTFSAALASLRSGRASVSATATPTQTPAPPPTPSPSPRPTPTATPSVPVSFGPVNGEISVEAGSKSVGEYDTRVFAADFSISARFLNPHAASTASWSQGFVFRETQANYFDVLVVRSSGQWYYERRKGSPDNPAVTRAGVSSKIITGPGESNVLKLFVIGAKGWFFINGEYAATLDLGEDSVQGGVSAVAGYFTQDSAIASNTRFESLTVVGARRSHGPSAGELVQEEGFIGAQFAGAEVANAVIEARFNVPQLSGGAGWDIGLMYRRVKVNEFMAFVVTSSGRWYWDWRRTESSGSGPLGSGTLAGEATLKTSPGASNTLTVIVVAEKGWFFVNGQLAQFVTAPGAPTSGRVAAIAGYFADTLPVGSKVGFDGFSVWDIGGS